MQNLAPCDRWLSVDEVATELGGFGVTSVYDFLNPKSPRYRPNLPTGAKLGERRRRWRQSDIQRYVASIENGGPY